MSASRQIDLVGSGVSRTVRSRLKKSLAALMSELGYGGHALTLVLVDDAEIRRLKLEHWGEDAATDVLSFPTYEPGDPFVPPHLGDIVISVETAQRQAEAQGHALEQELKILAAHSLWHLLGHDHPNPRAWSGFRKVQGRILEL